MTPWLDVFPSESVKFRCGMDSSSDSWTYSWYKDGKELQADVVSFDKDRTTLSISSALAKQHGHYSCSGKLKSRSVSSKHSSGLTLDVYGEICFFLFDSSLEKSFVITCFILTPCHTGRGGQCQSYTKQDVILKKRFDILGRELD